MTLRELLERGAPPPALARRITELASPFEAVHSDIAERCLEAAESGLRRLVRAGAPTRASALDLLAVDALVTYAFEAATAQPERVLPLAREAMVRLAAVRET